VSWAIDLDEGALVVSLGDTHRGISSAVLGGGFGELHTWLNIQVDPGYARADPELHLRDEAERRGLRAPVVGMMTAADVSAYEVARRRDAWAVATVGVSHPLAAAGRRAFAAPRVGTINLLVVSERPLVDAALVGATQTATEAKAQALADAGVRARNHRGAATGTATDSICVAAPFGLGLPFAGPATEVGAAVAHSVYAAISVALEKRLPLVDDVRTT
jgi:adenosylcobinamide hydrolase